jgi:CRP/FNR family transcriptional regulator, cyclic AMP receptor protein
MLNRIPLFEHLPAEALAQLESHTRKLNISKGHLLIQAGARADALYLILSGALRVYLSDSEGKEVVLAQLEAGEHVGEMALIDEQPRSASVVAASDAELCVLSKQAFNQVLQQHPELARLIMVELVQRLREADRKISSLALMDVYGRVAQLLLELAAPEGKLLIIHDKPSQQDMANRVGASREMVSKIMKDLALSGHIHVESKRIVIYPSLPSPE